MLQKQKFSQVTSGAEEKIEKGFFWEIATWNEEIIRLHLYKADLKLVVIAIFDSFQWLCEDLRTLKRLWRVSAWCCFEQELFSFKGAVLK